MKLFKDKTCDSNLEANNSSSIIAKELDDFKSAKEFREYTSPLAAFFCILNVKLGAALLTIPYASQQAGLVSSLVMMALFVAAVLVTCIICAELSAKLGVESYHKLIQTCCHRYIYQFSQAAILLVVLGKTIAGMKLVADQSEKLFAVLFGQEFCNTWYLGRDFIMTSATHLLIIPLCCGKSINFVRYVR